MFTNQACEESSGRLIIFLIVSFYLASIAAFQSSLPTKNDQRRTCRREYSSLHLAVESGSMITEITGAYTYCLDTWYLPTQSATGALFSFLGDGIAQANESSPTEMKEYDPTRGLICSFRGLGGGIIWTYWYDTADAWSLALTHNILSSTNMHELWEQTLRTFISIIGEQFLICPVIYSLWDIPVPALFNGSPPSQIPYQIQKKLVPLLIANAMVWTPANVITFNIPSEYRVLFTSAAGIVWNYLNSGITSKEISIDDVTAPSTSNQRQIMDIFGISVNSTKTLTTFVEKAI